MEELVEPNERDDWQITDNGAEPGVTYGERYRFPAPPHQRGRGG